MTNLPPPRCASCGASLTIRASSAYLYAVGLCPIACWNCRQLNTWDAQQGRNKPIISGVATIEHDEISGVYRKPDPAIYRTPRLPLKGLR